MLTRKEIVDLLLLPILISALMGGIIGLLTDILRGVIVLVISFVIVCLINRMLVGIRKGKRYWPDGDN